MTEYIWLIIALPALGTLFLHFFVLALVGGQQSLRFFAQCAGFINFGLNANSALIQHATNH